MDLSKILIESLVSAVFSGFIISFILGYFITLRDERIKKNIEEEFSKRDTFFNAQFNFKQRSLEELLGPIMLQFKRSEIALKYYGANDAYREGILKECNELIRDLLLKKGFLIPSELLPDAAD